MNKSRRWLLLFLACVIGSGVALAPGKSAANYYGGGPNVSVSVSFFHDQLEPYGEWVDYSPYGECWVPADVGPRWRPYSDGYWTYSDYGWTWVDYASWGWAPYHYGRWVYDRHYGWLWVPGTTWAPAWVAWYGYDDYIGWAPLPPNYGFASFSVNFYDVQRIPANRWCFVPTRNLCDRDVRYRFEPSYRNSAFLERGTNLTRYSQRNGRPVNAGFDVRQFERQTGRQVPRMRVVAADSPSRGRGQRVGSDRMAFYQPSVKGSFRNMGRQIEARNGERGWAQRSTQPAERNDRGQGLRADRMPQRQVERGRQASSPEWPSMDQRRPQRAERPQVQQPQERGRQRGSRGPTSYDRGAPSYDQGPPQQDVTRERGANRPSSNDGGGPPRGYQRPEAPQSAPPAVDRGGPPRGYERQQQQSPPQQAPAVDRGRGRQRQPDQAQATDQKQGAPQSDRGKGRGGRGKHGD